jgi:hypothetical protein
MLPWVLSSIRIQRSFYSVLNDSSDPFLKHFPKLPHLLQFFSTVLLILTLGDVDATFEPPESSSNREVCSLQPKSHQNVKFFARKRLKQC